MPNVPLQQTAGQEERPSAEEWKYEYVGGLSKGLDLSKRGRGLDRDGLITAQNVRLLRDGIVVDLGYKQFTQATIEGTPRFTWELFKNDGSAILCLLTNKTFYSWNPTAEEFEYNDGGGSTTVSEDESGFTINVVDASGFSSGDLIGLRMDSGVQHRTTVSSVSGNTINLVDPTPGGIASTGNAVTRPKHLTGSDDIQPSATTWAGTDKSYFTNGVNVPFWFDGSIVREVTGLPAGTVARIIDVHVNHLIIFNTIEGGTAHPHRERWSEPGDDTNWNTGVNFIDHVDTEDRITAVEPLGVYLIIYKERTLIRQEFIGSLEQTWNWTTVVTGEGTLGEDQVSNLGDEHIFWGNSNIYRYRGGFDIVPIGDPIFDGVFSVSEGDLNQDKAGRAFVVYSEETDELWVFYPRSGEEYPTRMLRYNLTRDAWTFRDFTFEVSGFGFYTASAGETWSQTSGSWEEDIGPWVSSALQAGAPTILLLDAAKKVYVYDFISADDNGVAISYEVETKDFFVPNRELRFDRYDMLIRGSNVLFQASLDEGGNYVTIGTLSPGTGFKRTRVYKQLVGRSIRFRFSGSGPFGLEDVAFLYKDESLWP